MPPRKTPALNIFYSNDEIKDSFQKLKMDWGMTYKALLRRMIEEVSTDERLRARIRVYDEENSEGGEGSKERKQICVDQDSETIALASELAFQICGNGSTSKLCRIMIRFYADHRDEPGLYSALAKPNKRKVIAAEEKRQNVVPIRPWRKLKTGPVTKIPSSLTFDHETDVLLDELVKRMKMRRMELISHLIEICAVDEKQIDRLRRSPELQDEIKVQRVKKRGAQLVSHLIETGAVNEKQIDRLQARNKAMTRMELVSHLIESGAVDKKQTDGLPPKLKDGLATTKPLFIRRVNLTPQVETLLKYITRQVVDGTWKKSAIVRALVKIEAGRQGLRPDGRKARR